jgi:hypothetical protein
MTSDTTPNCKAIASLSLLVTWKIWSERNARVFHNEHTPPCVIFDKIKSNHFYRCVCNDYLVQKLYLIPFQKIMFAAGDNSVNPHVGKHDTLLVSKHEWH